MLDALRPTTDADARTTRSDDRAVSPVVGAILLFGILILALGTIQTTAIPQLNAQAEFEHDERVATDFITLESTVERIVATGSGESVPVEVGFRYPVRPPFINPPPVSGRLDTGEQGRVTIENASADGEARDVWNGDDRSITTRPIRYRANYHEYDSATPVAYEHGVAYRQVDGTVDPIAGDGPIDGRRISLTAIQGNLSRSASGTIGLSLSPVSAPGETVTVRDEGGPITMKIPTQLSLDRWERLVEDDPYVQNITCADADCGRVTLTLERNVSYELRLAAVGAGSGVESPDPAYLVEVEGQYASVPAGSRQRLTVEARDRYDNPVSGVPVTATVRDGDRGSVSAPVTTGSDGRATFVYEAPATVDRPTDVSVTTFFGDGDASRVPFDVRLIGGSGTGTSGPSAPSVSISDVSVAWNGNHRVTVDATATDLDGDLDTMVYELRDPAEGTLIDTVSQSVSGSTASDTVVLRPGRANNRRDSYRVVVRATDATGRTDASVMQVSAP